MSQIDDVNFINPPIPSRGDQEDEREEKNSEQNEYYDQPHQHHQQQQFFHPQQQIYPFETQSKKDIFTDIDKTVYIVIFIAFILGFFMGKTMQPVIIRPL